MLLSSVDLTPTPTHVRVGEGDVVPYTEAPLSFQPSGPYSRLMVYGMDGLIGTGWLEPGVQFVPIVDCFGIHKGVALVSGELRLSRPPLVPCHDSHLLQWERAVDHQPYPLFVLDNQRPGHWDLDWFREVYHSVRDRITFRDGRRHLQSFLLMVSECAQSWQTGDGPRHSNPLWSSDVPGTVSTSSGRAKIVVCTWYALRRVVLPKRCIPTVVLLARRIYLFSAHCTHRLSGKRFVVVLYCSSRFARSGGTDARPVIPLCDWDGSLRRVICTLPPPDISRELEIDFMHCMRHPYVRFNVTPRLLKDIRLPGTVITCTRYPFGPWTDLAPLPVIRQPPPLSELKARALYM